MVTYVMSETVDIPSWIVDQEAFRRWARSPDYPQRGKVSFLNGPLWVDASMETLIHNLLKTAVVSTWLGIARHLGTALGDRMMLTNTDAGLSTEPDGLYFSRDALDSGRVRLLDGLEALEVVGSPDAVLEVVSKHSARKDTKVLPPLYWAANIPEYWLIDPRTDPISFLIYKHGPRGYQPVRRQGGWLKSNVFRLSFALAVEKADRPIPDYKLLHR